MVRRNLPYNLLLPKDSLSRMHVRSLVQVIASGVQPLQILKLKGVFSANKDQQRDVGF